jgi:hypothetical protein
VLHKQLGVIRADSADEDGAAVAQAELLGPQRFVSLSHARIVADLRVMVARRPREGAHSRVECA